MKNENFESEIRCPKCKSNQLSANKKGFSFKNALFGGVLTGGVGLIAGTIGSSKVRITCLNCGKVFKPGEGITKTSGYLSNNDKIETSKKLDTPELDLFNKEEKNIQTL